jgi:hypothetical protein|tara:strand:- start:115 stop:1347 length:1233 start_codon:yes stop_codon:yes gene_type:complete
MKYCNKCGEETKGSEKFCRKCGAKLVIPKKEPSKEIKVHKKEVHKEDTVKEEKREVKEKVKTVTTSGISKPIFYGISITLIVIIGVFVSLYVKYLNEFNDLTLQYQNLEQDRNNYKNLYQKESGLKQDEIRKRQTAESVTQRTEQQLTSEQKRAGSLQTELSQTEKELSSTMQQVEVVKNEFQDILYQINGLETFVKDNADLSGSRLNIIHSLCGNPITRDGDSCVIDANKMGSDMTSCIDFTWVDDKTTSNFADGQRIFDPDTFWSSKEGDCDDFAMFMAAWLRSEYDLAKSMCSQVSIKVKSGGWGSSPIYVNCPCKIYSVGGCYIGRDSCHMEVGISKDIDIYGYGAVNNIHVVEPQGGAYRGLAPNTYDGGVNWIFTENDFLNLNNNNVYRSLKETKQTAGQIDIG